MYQKIIGASMIPTALRQEKPAGLVLPFVVHRTGSFRARERDLAVKVERSLTKVLDTAI